MTLTRQGASRSSRLKKYLSVSQSRQLRTFVNHYVKELGLTNEPSGFLVLRDKKLAYKKW